MENKINPRLLQGFRDFLPKQKAQRDWLINTVTGVYRSFGFQPLETPVLEYADILLGKYGEEGSKLMYQFKDQGDRDVALRYDLTVPFARIIAQYPDLPIPFKRFQIAPVWRAESPQQGRFREFYQCDADIAGTSSTMADAEIVNLIYSTMLALRVNKFIIRINNRKILNGLLEIFRVPVNKTNAILIAIDKLEKIGIDAVKAELTSEKVGLEDDQAQKILNIISEKGSNDEIINKISAVSSDNESAQLGLNELKETLGYLKEMGVEENRIQFDLSIARGLDYYTGTVFETNLLDLPEFGSVFSGGRYDNLISTYTDRDIPAVGASVGIDRLFSAMEKLNLLPDTISTSQVMITSFSENIMDTLRIAKKLRENQIVTETYLGEKNDLSAQLKYASKKQIPFVIITFPDQIANDNYIVRKMSDGEQTETSFNNLLSVISSKIGK